MYGFDYTPATESIVSWFKNIVSTVGRKIKEVAEFLRGQITELGKKLKMKKEFQKQFRPNEDKAEDLIESISVKTRNMLDLCSDVIDEMYVDYLSVGKFEASTEKQILRVFKNDTLHFYNAKTNEIQREKYNSDGSISENRTAKLEPGKMQKGDDTSDEDWNKFQDKIGEMFESMHGDVDKIKQALTELQNMPPLSYTTTLEGYKELKKIYDANGDFGRHWDKLKTAHEFADPNGKIKKALGKIVSIYNVGVSAAKAFAVRLNTGDFKDEKGKDFRKSDKIYDTAKHYVKNMGEVSDKRVPDPEPDTYNAFGTLTDYRHERMKKAYDYKGKYKNVKYTKESAILSRLYDMAYEDARHDLEMKAEYISAFESVPNAFDEFETEI